jgi:hypothetical protein
MWDEEFLSIFHLMVCLCVKGVFGRFSFLVCGVRMLIYLVEAPPFKEMCPLVLFPCPCL